MLPISHKRVEKIPIDLNRHNKLELTSANPLSTTIKPYLQIPLAEVSGNKWCLDYFLKHKSEKGGKGLIRDNSGLGQAI